MPARTTSRSSACPAASTKGATFPSSSTTTNMPAPITWYSAATAMSVSSATGNVKPRVAASALASASVSSRLSARNHVRVRPRGCVDLRKQVVAANRGETPACSPDEDQRSSPEAREGNVAVASDDSNVEVERTGTGHSRAGRERTRRRHIPQALCPDTRPTVCSGRSASGQTAPAKSPSLRMLFVKSAPVRSAPLKFAEPKTDWTNRVPRRFAFEKSARAKVPAITASSFQVRARKDGHVPHHAPLAEVHAREVTPTVVRPPFRFVWASCQSHVCACVAGVST